MCSTSAMVLRATQNLYRNIYTYKEESALLTDILVVVEVVRHLLVQLLGGLLGLLLRLAVACLLLKLLSLLLHFLLEHLLLLLLRSSNRHRLVGGDSGGQGFLGWIDHQLHLQLGAATIDRRVVVFLNSLDSVFVRFEDDSGSTSELTLLVVIHRHNRHATNLRLEKFLHLLVCHSERRKKKKKKKSGV